MDSGDKLPMKKWLWNSLLAAVSVLVTIILIEGAYRIYLFTYGQFSPSGASTYRVANFPYSLYDANFGQRFKPNSKFTYFKVIGGKVAWCPEAVSISNKDGLGGKTTVDEYNRSEINILIFGDSFTHWNQQGYTWPDLLQERLTELINKKISVLNYARGTYGVLQMFDLAAAKIKEHEPDLVIFAFITADLTRNRWWTKTAYIDGYTRPLLSPRKDLFDLRSASDEYLVNPSVSLGWCLRSLNNSSANPILKSLNHQYAQIRASTFRARGIAPLSLTQLYLINRVLSGSPSKRILPIIPQIEFDNFASDNQLKGEVEEINASKVPYLLVHLPLMAEFKDSKMHANKQEASLLFSLEKLTGQRVGFIYEDIAKEELPDKIDLLPYDSHPNFTGLKLYAQLIADRAIRFLSAGPASLVR